MRKFPVFNLILVLLFLFLIPFLTNAIEFGPYTKFQSLFEIFDSIRKFAYLFLAPIAIIVVLVGAFQFLTSAGAPDKIAKAKQTLFYGVIGIAVVIFAAAIPTILMNVMGIEKPIAQNGTPVATKTCSQLNGTCCPSDKICNPVSRISGASDCIDCCFSVTDCQEITQPPTDWPHDPAVSLSQLLSNPGMMAQIGDSTLQTGSKIKGEIDSLFGF